MFHGSMFDHYSKLGRYIEELKKSKHGSSSIVVKTMFPNSEHKHCAFVLNIFMQIGRFTRVKN